MKAMLCSAGAARGRRRCCAQLVVAALILAWTAGCTGEAPAATPAPTATVPVAGAAQPTSAVTRPSGPTETVLTLTWWTPEFLSPQAPAPAGLVLSEQLAEFELAQAGKVNVEPVLKARYGKGGLLDLLRSAQPVAPSVLPDLVSLDVAELESAVAAALLQPLDELLDEEIGGSLYGFARTSGRFDGRLYALQYVADVGHLVYRPDQVPEPPGTWDQLLSAGAPYLLPLADPGSSAAGPSPLGVQGIVLSQYLSADSQPDQEGRQLALASQPLFQLLTFYEAAGPGGVLAPAALELADAEAVWSVFIQGRTPLAEVTAGRYLAERESAEDSAFAATPGHLGPAVPVADGWVIAIVTPDPQRQEAAAALLAWLLRPENAGAFSQAAGWLPTSPAAFAVWDADPYTEFLAGQLSQALSFPIGPESAQAAGRLQAAVVSVAGGQSSALDAVDPAIAPED